MTTITIIDVENFIKKVAVVKVLGKDEVVNRLLIKLEKDAVGGEESWLDTVVELLFELRRYTNQAQLECIKMRIIDENEFLTKVLDEMYLGVGVGIGEGTVKVEKKEVEENKEKEEKKGGGGGR